MANLVRVNTNISEEMNEFLDLEKERTGMGKNVLIRIALEDFMEKRVLKRERIEKLKN